VQLGFVLTSIVLGVMFANFVSSALTSEHGELPPRPPGVEGYLPISGFMGLIDWIRQGVLNDIHPAATVLFLLFILISIVVRKAFCGWICPVGFISEWLARIGQLIFKRNFRLPDWLDFSLRGIKYFLLAFFAWAILNMSAESLRAFIESPYNKISDVKMGMFFLNLSGLAAGILIGLILLSILIHSFWCRYLCPYGALMGLFSWMSPIKVRRDPVTCTDCGICEQICPARLPVDTKLRIIDPECIGCGDCVTSCPVPEALEIGTRKDSLTPFQLAVITLGIFLIGYVGARSFGIWQNSLSSDEVRYHINRMDSEEYGHPGR